MSWSDLRSVDALEKVCFSDPWPLWAYQQELRDTATAHYLVAVAGGHLVGYLGARIVEDEAYITTLGVSPDCRQRGVAKQLLLHLIDHSAPLGVVRLTLEVRESNAAARRLYERFGFTEVAIRQAYYSHPVEDAIVMWVSDTRGDRFQAAVAEMRASVRHTVAGDPTP